MIRNFCMILFYLSLAFLCQGMMIVKLPDDFPDFPGKYAYVPTNDNDKRRIAIWGRKNTVNHVTFSVDGINMTGYIVINSHGLSFPDLECFLEHSMSMMFIPMTASGPSGAFAMSQILPICPRPSPLGGNPESDTVCIDALFGACKRTQCDYRHLSKQQTEAVNNERMNKPKKSECIICTNETPHDPSTCRNLHI